MRLTYLLVLLHISYLCQGAVTAAEKNQWISFYNALNGPNWLPQHQWDLGTDPCTPWYGVTCPNGNNYVQDVDLSQLVSKGSPLTGTLVDLNLNFLETLFVKLI